MIHLNDLVRLQYEPPPIYGGSQLDRRGWIGIVIGVMDEEEERARRKDHVSICRSWAIV